MEVRPHRVIKRKKTKKTDSFFDKAGNVLKTIWDYISTGRDYFWKGVRFTLATGIFLVVVFNLWKIRVF